MKEQGKERRPKHIINKLEWTVEAELVFMVNLK
jgi:hypothetical protein